VKKVLIIMGSDSDYEAMEACFKNLQKFGIDFDATVCSAHRSPDRAAELAKTAADAEYGVIIAGAGLAAHLPGVLAAFTVLPVIGVPLSSGALNGVDALLAEVQMPPGIPVATVAINGSANAAILAAQILAVENKELRAKLLAYKVELSEQVSVKARKLEEKINEKFKN
jgi:5-(carboxyamino)imidazole ribonucleotide mutase